MNFTQSYANLLISILSKGYMYDDPNRKGVKRIELFPAMIMHDMSESFPLLASKKMYTRGIFIELLWMLTGRTDLNYLRDRSLMVWDKDAYNFAIKKGYKGTLDEFVEEVDAGNYFDLGPLYGKQWRNVGGKDQLLSVINSLLDDTKKHSSALIINSWNVQDLHKMALPPCHHEIQFNCRPDVNSRGILDLQFSMRSSDVILGLPWNFAFYGMLLEIVAAIVKMKPGNLTYFGKKVHIYDNQIEAAKEIINRMNKSDFMQEPLVQVNIADSHIINEFDSASLNSLFETFDLDTIKFSGYKHLGLLDNQPEMLAYS